MVKLNTNNQLVLAALVSVTLGFCTNNTLARGGGHGGGHGGGFERHGEFSGGHRGNFNGVRINNDIHIHNNTEIRNAGSWHHDHGHGYYHGGRGVYWHGGYGYWSGSNWFWNGVAVTLAIGAIVATLPPSYEVVYVQGMPYYYYNNVYYRPAADGYVVVARPY